VENNCSVTQATMLTREEKARHRAHSIPTNSTLLKAILDEFAGEDRVLLLQTSP